MIPSPNKSWPVVLGIACLIAGGCASPGGIADLRPGSANVADGPMSQEEIRDFNFSVARALESDGQFQKAAQMYERMRKEDPDQPVVAHRLAIAYDKLGKSDRAQELFREALAENPEDPDLLADYGYSLYLAGKFDEAETALRQAIELAPADARAHVNLGLVLCRLDRFDEAEQAFKSGGLDADQTQMNVAYALSIEGQLEEARNVYARLREKSPENEDLEKRIGQIDEVLARMEPAEIIEPEGIARVTTASAVADDASPVSPAEHSEPSED